MVRALSLWGSVCPSRGKIDLIILSEDLGRFYKSSGYTNVKIKMETVEAVDVY